LVSIGHRAEILFVLSSSARPEVELKEACRKGCRRRSRSAPIGWAGADASTLRAKALESVDFSTVRAVRRRLFRSRGKGALGGPSGILSNVLGRQSCRRQMGERQPFVHYSSAGDYQGRKSHVRWRRNTAEPPDM